MLKRGDPHLVSTSAGHQLPEGGDDRIYSEEANAHLQAHGDPEQGEKLTTKGLLIKRMKMKISSSSVLCLSILLSHAALSLAKKGGGFGKSFGTKKIPSSRGSSHTNTGSKPNQGSTSNRGNPKQPTQNNQGGYPVYPRQQGGGGYYPQFPQTGYGQPGGYPGGHINRNPANAILSPHYGGSFGYGGYGTRGGSPFSQSVQAMGKHPSSNSRNFGRSAVMAAAGGAVAGMALGYGLGRFPRPHFQFRNPQEEQYYNSYMYSKYGTKSTDANDYGRDYSFSPPPQGYNSYMDSCMKRTNLLPTDGPKPGKQSAGYTAPAQPASPNAPPSETKTSNGSSEVSSNDPGAPARLSQIVAEDDDEVSIVEIGYPALIEQLKARKCLELYMIYSQQYLTRLTGGAQRLTMDWQGLLAVVFGSLLMVINCNIAEMSLL
ncbi:prion protein b [Menidia menidia]